MLPPPHRAASAGRRRRPAACGCRRAGGRDRSVSSWRSSCCTAPLARARAPARTIRASACDSSAAWRPRIATRPGKPANAGRPLERRARAGSSAWTRAARRGAQPIVQPIDPAAELVLRRDDHLRRRRRRRRAHVGDEVGDRDVGFVADRRDDRHRHARDRARDDLLVERPQILDRAAAAADDHDVDAGHARDRAQRRARSRAPRPRPARAPGG